MMEQQIRFCTTSDGVRIAYATVGQGPPIVRVLGWFTHLEFEWERPDWQRWFTWGLLAQSQLYVRYDGRGMGLSDRQVDDLSPEAQVRDLEAVVDALNLDRVALYGMSQGGATAITYAVRHPERVTHLILYGSYARSSSTSEEHLTRMTLIRQGWGSDVPAHRQFFTGLFMPDADADAIRLFNEVQRVSTSPEMAVALYSAMQDIDVYELLGQVDVPTLVIHRRGDAIVPFEFGRELAAHIPGARFLPLEGRNHVIQPNEPANEIFRRAVEDFLREGGSETQAAMQISGLVTILFTDMEGSTTLTQRLGDAKAQDVLRTHNTIVRDALKAHSGSEIKHTGDGIMASFASASRALECAIDIQRALAQHNESAEEPIRVRIGLNAGEPVAEEKDLFGTAVQLAARICAHAEPDEILTSDLIKGLAAGKGFLFADRGDVALRGFEEPVRLYEVRWRE